MCLCVYVFLSRASRGRAPAMRPLLETGAVRFVDPKVRKPVVCKLT